MKAASKFSNIRLLTACRAGVCLSSALLLTSQVPEARAQAPAATAETAKDPEPSRPEVEQYVKELKELISRKEENVTGLVNEIGVHDQAIQEAVKKVLSLLTGAEDSQRTHTRVARLKADTVAGLEKAAKTYAAKRNQIAAQLKASGNPYTRDDLFKVRGVMDERVGKLVDAAVELAAGMETDEGHEKYIQGSNVVVGRGGIGVHEILKNPEYDHNKREAKVTEGVRKNLTAALAESRKRLGEDLRRVEASLAEPGLTEEKKAQLTQEKDRLAALISERSGQQEQLDSDSGSAAAAGAVEVANAKEFSNIEDIIKETAAGARRHFARLLTAYQDLSEESVRLGALKAKLDFSEKWLESHPAGK